MVEPPRPIGLRIGSLERTGRFPSDRLAPCRTTEHPPSVENSTDLRPRERPPPRIPYVRARHPPFVVRIVPSESPRPLKWSRSRADTSEQAAPSGRGQRGSTG